jgi:hypothetical protein
MEKTQHYPSCAVLDTIANVPETNYQEIYALDDRI